MFRSSPRLIANNLQYSPLHDGKPLRAVSVWAALRAAFKVRRRYFYTRRNGLRLRYKIAMLIAVFMLAGGGVMAMQWNTPHNDDPNFVPAPYQDEADADPATFDENPADATPAPTASPVAQVAPIAQATPAAVSIPTYARRRDTLIRIGRGDTLAGVLTKAGMSGNDAHNAIAALKPYYNPRALTPGQKLALRFDAPASSNAFTFTSLNVTLDPLSSVQLTKNPTGNFQAAVEKQEAVRRVYARRLEINSSFYGSALKAHVPASIIASALKIYSWNVDFQRDIQPGDTMQVMYEQYEAPNGTPIRSGDIVYASLSVNGRDLPIYRYQTRDGDVDYFTPSGVSIRKALLSTPVDGARISSGFGMRMHPVLGFTKMHKGIDFAAPIGTPIFAAGNGTIEKIGPFSTYGNYIRIRHNSTLKTAYAHMLRFASGLRDGMRVKQGEVIGYIGVTGRSTGPHLHYEVLINDQQVNPHGVKVQQGEALVGKQLASFKAHVRDMAQRFNTLLGDKFASAENFNSNVRFR